MSRVKSSVSSRQSSAQTGPAPLPATGSLPASRHLFACGHPSCATVLATCPCARKAGAAFTMIELLVVIAIIAILAGLTLSTLGYVNRRGAEFRARAEVAAISSAIDSFFLDYGTYPASNNLVRELTGHAAAPINTNRKVYFEPTPNIIGTNAGNVVFIDPWGGNYNYATNATVNIGFFDLWSSAGNSNSSNAPNWIRN